MGGNPSPLTALGVYLGIKAAIREKLGTDSAAGVLRDNAILALNMLASETD